MTSGEGETPGVGHTGHTSPGHGGHSPSAEAPELSASFIGEVQTKTFVPIILLLQISMIFVSMHFHSGELKRKDDLLASMDKKQDEAREKMQEVISHCHLVVY